MARKKRRPGKTAEQSVHPDPRIALLAADAFRAASRPFLQKVIGKHLDVANREATKDLGGLVASATTLALAIELYLKALWLLHGKRAPGNHNLWALYKYLPPDLQKSVEEAYRRVPERPDFEAVGLQLRITAAGRPEPEQDKRAPMDNSLAGVLKQSSDAFVTWRYIHEGGRPVIEVGYEFHFLGVIADVLSEHVHVGLRRQEELRAQQR